MDLGMSEKDRKRILVVDDDSTMLLTLRLWLSDKYKVFMANSGKDAMKLLSKQQVDLVLLDYEMPEASGPEVLEMIRREKDIANTPVMFLTAVIDEESISNAMEHKPEKYLLKTTPPDVLMEDLDEFFATHDRTQ